MTEEEAFALKGCVVRFHAGIEDLECYAEANMLARILQITCQDAEVWRVTFDFSEFESENAKLESANYYDRRGVACLTAREANHYEEKEVYFLPPPSQWRSLFEVMEEPRKPALSWLPMDAAPRDGTPFIALWDGHVYSMKWLDISDKLDDGATDAAGYTFTDPDLQDQMPDWLEPEGWLPMPVPHVGEGGA